ncbi:IclR family transcriptional regulator [Devriesea agamarum]|uniref:IclR family transcriptional regulator n=1 Tax=Devriesea agamarum TaxID=472569 RepID=UPI000AE86F63|nr:IclR family transcriptional regulator [Devriesea agamarum]
MSSKVPAADATLRVLAHLSAQRGPVPAARLAAELQLPRSTVYDLLSVLTEHGFVLHLREERLYGLGPAAFALSSAYSRQAPLARVGRPVMERLVDEIGESGHLAVLHGRDVLYIVEERARNRPSLVTDVGVRIPAHLTASGRSLLAGLPPAHVNVLYSSVEDFTHRTSAAAPRSPRELKDLLKQVRRDGVAHECGEVTEGFASVAALARDHAGMPAAAVALTWVDTRAGEEEAARFARAVRRAADDLTRALHGRKP